MNRKKITMLGILTIILIAACTDDKENTPEPNFKPIPTDRIFYTFETGQVRPLSMSPNGQKLFVANTPNSSLEVYSINAEGLAASSTLAVGMEPTAVAALNDNEVWVVNHLSDSVSVVDVSSTPPRIIKTLLVGDEPRDIVFAGENKKFAFITAAHRGQNGPNDLPIDGQLTTEGVGRADVWVFDTTATGNTIGGDPVAVITLFGDTPRALTVSPDGKTVYAAVFLSGNKTTTLGEGGIAKQNPVMSADSKISPDTGLIVQHNGSNWVDAEGSVTDISNVSYDSKIPFSLPDYDVFTIDASLAIPTLTESISGVGTTIFNMVTNPVSGKVYVSNTNALNLTRFEGEGKNSSTVRGHFVESRISVINNSSVTPRHLNKHIDYTQFIGTQAERELAISQPMDMAVTSDGKTLYITGFGSKKIVFYRTDKLENDEFSASSNNQVNLSAGGPSGIVLDELNNRLYVLTRFDNGISTIDTESNLEISHLKMFNPEPPHIVAGRSFLYDSTMTSSHGDSSCGLCHVFADFDGLAWDLGNPDENVVTNPNQFVNQFLTPDAGNPPVFHPLKGPMTTQSFRGLKGNGPMHWRGDRIGVSAAAGESIELGAFKDFNVAFPGLVGSEAELSAEDMQAFAEFSLDITYPPNPIRSLDNSLSGDQTEGRRIYMDELTTGQNFTCNTCHVLDPVNNMFGTGGLSSIEGPDISQQFKVPHLRNMYQKVGKFGNSGRFSTDTLNYGEQIKGFGFMHDGGMDTLDKFFQGTVFRFDQNPVTNKSKRDKVVDFVMAMDSELAPIVGQQITLTALNSEQVTQRVNLLRSRAMITSPREECDLIVKGVINGLGRGYFMQADGSYQSDKNKETITDMQLRALVNDNNQKLTFTCVPPGAGQWMGLDRDVDGIYDADEIAAGSNPTGM